MIPASTRALIELIADLVDSTGRTWKEKRDDVLAHASDDEKVALGEFASWFAED